MANIWILTNGEREFVKACSTREIAKAEMERWRENIIKSELFQEVSKLDAVYAEVITFKATAIGGKEYEFYARETILD